MKKRLVVLGVTASVLLSLFPSKTAYAQRKWNNPESEKRYKALRQEALDAHRNESKALENYDRELGKAQKDAGRVIEGATHGALKGGAPGAAWGAATGAGKGIYERGKDYYKDRKRK